MSAKQAQTMSDREYIAAGYIKDGECIMLNPQLKPSNRFFISPCNLCPREYRIGTIRRAYTQGQTIDLKDIYPISNGANEHIIEGMAKDE